MKNYFKNENFTSKPIPIWFCLKASFQPSTATEPQNSLFNYSYQNKQNFDSFRGKVVATHPPISE